MARWIGVCLLGLGLAGTAMAPALAEAPTPASTEPPSAAPPVTCAGEGAGRRCTVAAIQDFANNRGGQSALSLNAVRDATCTTLHIVFDGPIDVTRPVILSVDGAPPQRFYTPDELTELARALDDGAQTTSDTGGTPPEFARFLTQVSTGAIKDADAGQEMLNRFAAIKETRRVGLACGPMERLLPLIRAGHSLRLEFQVDARTATQVYHWPKLDSRVVELRLDGLLSSLDRTMPRS